MVSHRSLSSHSFVFLVQDCSGGKCQGINFQDELFEGVGSVEDGVINGDVD